MANLIQNPLNRGAAFGLGGRILLFNPLTFLGVVQLITHYFPQEGLRAELISSFLPTCILLTVVLIAFLIVVMRANHSIKTAHGFRALVALSFFVVGVLVYLGQTPFFAGRFQVFRILLLLITGRWWVRAFYFGIMRNPSASTWYKNVATAVFGICALLILGEGIFHFVARSNQNNLTLASKVWFARHWELNSFGYRDAEMETKLNSKHSKILLLGDSFTSGHGIEDPKDRFGDRLDEQLTDWEVLNLGMNGSEPENELERLKAFETDAEVLLLVWFVNDIHEAAAQTWQSWTEFADYPEPRRRYWNISLVRGSYLGNYLAALRPTKPGKSYREFLETAYAREAVFAAHHLQLRAIFTEARSRNMQPAVVLFPFIEDVEGSEFALRPMRKAMEQDSIPYLDLSRMLTEKGPAEGRVNVSDPHPNEAVHALVATELAQFLQEEGLLNE